MAGRNELESMIETTQPKNSLLHDLYHHVDQNHGVMLLDSDMHEILHVIRDHKPEFDAFCINNPARTPLKDTDIVQKVDEWNALDSDFGRLRWLQHNPGVFVVMLDNDDTDVRLADDVDLTEEQEDEIYSNLKRFDEYFGDDKGIFALFEALGVKAEPV